MNHKKLAVSGGLLAVLGAFNVYMNYNDYPVLPIALVAIIMMVCGGIMVAEVIKNNRK